MEPVAEAMVGFVMTLATASYCHFGVALKSPPALQHPHAQHGQLTVQRLPVSAMTRTHPAGATVAERTVLIRRA